MRTVASVLAAILLATAARAQEPPRVLDPISVIGTPERFGDHADTVAPTLVFEAADLESFEPVSVGEMLKRLPGVAFNSEAGQFEAPQLRGIGPEYTQILINGQRIPGAENDRGVLVDRIPPGLIERIEILRSPSAEYDAQGAGGTINLVLKSGAQVRGGEVRTNVATTNDGTVRGGGALSYAGASGPLSWLGGVDVRRRFEPREKDLVTRDPAAALLDEQTGREDRDGVDTGLNGRLSWQLGGAKLDAQGFGSLARNDSDLLLRPLHPVRDEDDKLTPGRFERDEVRENSYGLDLRAIAPRAAVGEWTASAGFGRATVDRDMLGGEFDEGREVPTEKNRLRARDQEYRLGLATNLSDADAHQLRLGLQGGRRKRDSDLAMSEADEKGELQDVTPGDGVYAIKETRLDAYAQDRWQLGAAWALDAGLRAEHTQIDQAGFDVDHTQLRDSARRLDLSPNLNLRWDASPEDRLRLSLARTLRRPDFNQLVPFRGREGRRFVIGNPELDPERSLGLDLGYDRRLGGDAVLGLNLFYRRIENLIERRSVAENTVSPTNLGHGRVWGAELDGTWSPDFADLELSANLSLFDSEVRDPFTGQTRRFQLQPAHVLNLGVAQPLPILRSRWGVNLTHSGASREVLADETNHFRYSTELEAFVEFQATPSVLLRLSGSNLLDSRVTETVMELDQTQIERETFGPVAMLTLRSRF